MATDLLDALHAHRGLVCLVGAGGKKTTLYRLASAHPGRVGITATVYIPPFPKTLGALKIIRNPADLLNAVVEAAAFGPPVAFARPAEKRARLAGVDPAQVAQIHRAAGFDVTFIKADGARGRWIKAPNQDEPQIPLGATTVIAVVSARAIGEPLTERIAHRVDRIAAVTGGLPGEPVTAEHVARLFAGNEGALKDVGDALVVPLINMVDDAKKEAIAEKAAEQALALSQRFDRVVLASMTSTQPLVRIVSR
ncbi:MAG: putative selenium-dependent hydroxylase accessory protein YqeC [Gammaproteobacteria bacterium]|nr:putative selenium-dependent hydroxylase accessory protein YqeC [Gammaproteobacteria bacterium]MCI0590205.1 putative selenium-dependent hydroxylase accessory protein YqeC [Gammaproteobacteria bacterium]